MPFDPDYDWDTYLEEDYEIAMGIKPRRFRCSDGFCGQEDCERCRPGCLEDPVIDLLN